MAKHIPPRDVLEFVGKTGFITFELWKKYFFKAKSKRSMYHNWNELIRRKYLIAYPIANMEKILVLERSRINVKSFFESKPAYIPNPNQIFHDEILLDGIMKLDRTKEICQWQTEAELKMLSPDDYRVETRGQLIKYPDAIIYLIKDNRSYAVAIEYERTQKSRKRYDPVASSYAGMKNINCVIWIVRTPSIQKMITEQLIKNYFPFKERGVGFVSEGIWKQNPEKLVGLVYKILEDIS